MSSQQEFEFLFIKEAVFSLMKRGVPALLAENQIGFLVRRLVERGDIIKGTRVELVLGRKGERPVMCFVRQAVYLRLFMVDAIRDVWVRVQIPRHEVDLIAPPPFQPAANGNARMLADGTTGQPLPISTGSSADARAKVTINEQVKKWFEENSKHYRLDERGEKTRMYGDAARALQIKDDTAKTYLSPLVNGKN